MAMSALCPLCKHPTPDNLDLGTYECENCGAQLLVQVDGSLEFASVSPSPLEAEFEFPSDPDPNPNPEPEFLAGPEQDHYQEQEQDQDPESTPNPDPSLDPGPDPNLDSDPPAEEYQDLFADEPPPARRVRTRGGGRISARRGFRFAGPVGHRAVRQLRSVRRRGNASVQSEDLRDRHVRRA
ncbi:MAG: hypothetical protein HC902_12065 [Calothrix sp. SM1_5_4]|nr:hypothetical protein [Calothrix sp. SM1_5_4]